MDPGDHDILRNDVTDEYDEKNGREKRRDVDSVTSLTETPVCNFGSFALCCVKSSIIQNGEELRVRQTMTIPSVSRPNPLIKKLNLILYPSAKTGSRQFLGAHRGVGSGGATSYASSSTSYDSRENFEEGAPPLEDDFIGHTRRKTKRKEDAHGTAVVVASASSHRRSFPLTLEPSIFDARKYEKCTHTSYKTTRRRHSWHNKILSSSLRPFCERRSPDAGGLNKKLKGARHGRGGGGGAPGGDRDQHQHKITPLFPSKQSSPEKNKTPTERGDPIVWTSSTASQGPSSSTLFTTKGKQPDNDEFKREVTIPARGEPLHTTGWAKKEEKNPTSSSDRAEENFLQSPFSLGPIKKIGPKKPPSNTPPNSVPSAPSSFEQLVKLTLKSATSYDDVDDERREPNDGSSGDMKEVTNERKQEERGKKEPGNSSRWVENDDNDNDQDGDVSPYRQSTKDFFTHDLSPYRCTTCSHEHPPLILPLQRREQLDIGSSTGTPYSRGRQSNKNLCPGGHALDAQKCSNARARGSAAFYGKPQKGEVNNNSSPPSSFSSAFKFTRDFPSPRARGGKDNIGGESPMITRTPPDTTASASFAPRVSEHTPRMRRSAPEQPTSPLSSSVPTSPPAAPARTWVADDHGRWHLKTHLHHHPRDNNSFTPSSRVTTGTMDSSRHALDGIKGKKQKRDINSVYSSFLGVYTPHGGIMSSRDETGRKWKTMQLRDSSSHLLDSHPLTAILHDRSRGFSPHIRSKFGGSSSPASSPTTGKKRVIWGSMPTSNSDGSPRIGRHAGTAIGGRRKISMRSIAQSMNRVDLSDDSRLDSSESYLSFTGVHMDVHTGRHAGIIRKRIFDRIAHNKDEDTVKTNQNQVTMVQESGQNDDDDDDGDLNPDRSERDGESQQQQQQQQQQLQQEVRHNKKGEVEDEFCLGFCGGEVEEKEEQIDEEKKGHISIILPPFTAQKTTLLSEAEASIVKSDGNNKTLIFFGGHDCPRSVSYEPGLGGKSNISSLWLLKGNKQKVVTVSSDVDYYPSPIGLSGSRATADSSNQLDRNGGKPRYKRDATGLTLLNENQTTLSSTILPNNDLSLNESSCDAAPDSRIPVLRSVRVTSHVSTSSEQEGNKACTCNHVLSKVDALSALLDSQITEVQSTVAALREAVIRAHGVNHDKECEQPPLRTTGTVDTVGTLQRSFRMDP